MAAARVVLVQLEVPMDVVEAAVALARAAHVPVICDPAPVADLSDTTYGRLTWITPNEHEAAELTGHDDPVDAAGELHRRGVPNVVVTLGARGAFYLGEAARQGMTIGAPRVEAVDTVACGDAFTGCLGASLAAGLDAIGAIRRATAAGAAAASVHGAAASLPDQAAVQVLLDRGDL
jgi:ribokinase